MQIHSVRLGFATNSSSTHSLVMIPDDVSVKDKDVSGRFGWEPFTAISYEAKNRYLSILLREALTERVNVETATRIVKALTGVELGCDYWGEYDYIDHQSVYTLPVSRDGRGLNWEFYEAFSRYLLQDNLAILGGNDNDCLVHPSSTCCTPADIPVPKDSYYQFWARHDEKYDFWTLFNPSTGAKIRFSFDDREKLIEKASTPELVDLRITNYCTMNCPYCYQNSSKDGLHGQSISRIVNTLTELQVFEVAVGGGEPTEHPKFGDLVRRLYSKDIVVNFSTRNYNWFHIPANRELLGCVGGVAFSVSNSNEARKFVRDVVNRYGLHDKISFHVVDRVMKRFDLSSLLELAEGACIPVTLLGFKDVGRGAGFSEKRDSWVMAVQHLREYKKRLPRLGVDTAIVQEYKKELEELYVSTIMTAGDEGKFSMYIDLVDNVVGRSSYEHDTFVDVPEKMPADLIEKAFAQW